jgi:hypothetical protein
MTSSQPGRSVLREQAFVFAAIVGLLLAHAAALGESPQDDAFISFRYARNWLAGHGLVFNPGERVEGYTNFLWTVAMAPVVWSGVEPAQGARAVGLLCASATLLLLWSAAGRGTRAGWAGITGGAILVASSSYVAEAVQGLETSLFAVLLTALLLRTEQEERAGGNGILPGVLGGFAALTRPEGSLVAIAAAIHRLLPAPFGPGGAGASFRTRALPAARSIAICLAIAVPHRLIAWSWYGEPVPNTFYAKVGGSWDAVLRGADYAGGFTLAWLPVLALAIVGLIPLRPSQRSLRAVFVAGYVLYVIAVGGDHKRTFRFFVPVMPLVALLAGAGIATLAARLAAPRARIACVCALVAACLGATWLLAADAREFSRVRAQRYRSDRLLGEWLARNLPADALLATSNAGVIPYYAGLATIDMLGLTDRHIAHAPISDMGRGKAGHERADGAYVIARRPDVILFMRTRTSEQGPVPLERAGRQLSFKAERQLWQNPEFLREYEWVSAPLPGYTVNYFRRRASPSDSASAP